VPRVARLNELLREILADELERIDDERLDLVTITNVDVDADLNRAIVRYDSFAGEEGDARILEALSERRVRLQAALGRQMRVRKTPILEFRPDEVLRSAERIDDILRSNPLPDRPEPEPEPEETEP
jgi:ribosome-binding factor A